MSSEKLKEPPVNADNSFETMLGAPLQMTVKILQGRNIKSGKADKITTIAKITYPGFGPKESSPVVDSVNPVYNLDHSFNMRLDDVSIIIRDFVPQIKEF